jgi:glycosyltransferase involved in cell wall biosynthesis
VFQTGSENETQAYFIGKLLWTKGLNNMLALQDYYKQTTGDYFSIDIWGSGPDKEEISRAYLGRSSRKEKKAKKRRTSFVVKAFAWANKRRRKSRNEPLQSFSSSKFRDSLEQLAKDLARAKESMESLSSRARESIEQLADDLSKMKFENSPIPKTFHEFRKNPIPATFPGRIDHAQLKNSYKIFINPSVSEVLCTTTFEALAMGKFAIIPVHPSNTFFLQFPNCLGYRDHYEFVTNLQWALTHHPEPLTKELAREFSWEAATDRFLNAAAINHRDARLRESLGKSKVDERIAWFHNELGKGAKGDIIRKVLGGGPVSNQVKYESEKRRNRDIEIAGLEEDEDGLSRKFRDSAFVESIRQATANSISNILG